MSEVDMAVVKPESDLGETSNAQNVENDIFARKVDFDDVDIDDEIDPALKEKIDREVEDFARRLNSDWPERMQEILSLGQDTRPLRHSINDNGTVKRYASVNLHLSYCLTVHELIYQLEAM